MNSTPPRSRAETPYPGVRFSWRAPRAPHRGTKRSRLALALVATLLAAPFAALSTPLAALAEQSPPPSASAPPADPAPPLITDPADGAFIDRNRLTISGQGVTAGNTVSVTVAGAAGCTTSVTAALTWTCTIPSLANSTATPITAVEELDDNTSRQSVVTVAVLGPPQLDDVSPSPGYVTGTGHPDATVTVILPGGATCATRVTASGYWSCTPLDAGGARPPTGAQNVTANQSHSAIGAGASSSATGRTILFDTQRPDPPVIVQPGAGSRITKLPATFRGTGETGATVDVYLGGIPVCTAVVEGGQWECYGGAGLNNGSHSVRAVQRDQASNFSDPSAIVRFTFTAPAPAPAPTPTPTPTPEPSESPSPSAPPSSFPPPSDSPWPIPDAGGSLPQALTNWGSPTNFSTGIPGLQESVDRGNWWRAPLLALAAIVLVALPLRLLASTMRGRIRWPFGQITGRNTARSGATDSVATSSGPLTPWLSMSLPFAVTVAFMVVAGGVSGEVRYLRLAVAVAGALAILNIVGVAVASRIGSVWQGVETQFRFRGLLFAAAIASGLVSRLIGLAPPLITGTLLGVRPNPEAPVRKRAIIGIVQVGTVLVLGLVGWIGFSAIGPVVGFWLSLFSEFFAALCLAGLGSAVMLLLPVGGLPGRVVYEWHRWAWFGIALGVATVTFGVLLGGASARFPLSILLLLAGGLAAVCVGVWAYFTLVARPSAAPVTAVRQPR